jgi:hypothetical protein
MATIFRELRGLVQDIYTITQEDKKDLFITFNQQVVIPFFRKVTQAIVSEMGAIRTDISRLLGGERDMEVDKVVKRSVKNFSPLLSAEYKEFIAAAASALQLGDIDMKAMIDRVDSVIGDGEKRN